MAAASSKAGGEEIDLFTLVDMSAIIASANSPVKRIAAELADRGVFSSEESDGDFCGDDSSSRGSCSGGRCLFANSSASDDPDSASAGAPSFPHEDEQHSGQAQDGRTRSTLLLGVSLTPELHRFGKLILTKVNATFNSIPRQLKDKGSKEGQVNSRRSQS